LRFDDLPTLHHESVFLRPIESADIAGWFAYLRLAAVFEHTSWNVQSPDELSHYAWKPEEFTDSSLLRFAIASKATGRLVGTAGFHSISPRDRTAELAYDLNPELWGRGIASAVCAELTAWAHRSARIVRVQASVLKTNARSISVLERCGFVREGLLRSYRMVRGTPGDFYMYSHLDVGRPVGVAP
jgi:ribosomal-protein-alanine N-acetyltransferase